ncbi:hypothetical protein BTZ20_5832 [Rhodococcus sp. MTM3W5.2]|nr:hypothetical protein BTZ20_5832 [Rhodococcus sp. MTM3W5.2]
MRARCARDDGRLCGGSWVLLRCFVVVAPPREVVMVPTRSEAAVGRAAPPIGWAADG